MVFRIRVAVNRLEITRLYNIFYYFLTYVECLLYPSVIGNVFTLSVQAVEVNANLINTIAAVLV